MTALIVIGAIILFFVLLALLRVGVDARYGEEGAVVRLRIAFLRITVYPEKRPETKRERQKERKKKRKKKEKEGPPEEEKAGGLDTFKGILDGLVKALGRLRQKLTIDLLQIHLVIGAENAAAAALRFGAGNAIMGVIVPLLENNFNVKERDLRTDVDFMAGKTKIAARATLTMAVWHLFYIAAGFLFPFLKGRAKKSGGGRKKSSRETKNEQKSK